MARSESKRDHPFKLHDPSGSPLLALEDLAAASLLKIHGELMAQLAGKKIEDYQECKHLLQLLEKKEYDILETALVERYRLAGFCLGDDIEKFTKDLLKLVKVSSSAYLAYDLLILLIRLACQEGL